MAYELTYAILLLYQGIDYILCCFDTQIFNVFQPEILYGKYEYWNVNTSQSVHKIENKSVTIE